MSEVDGVFVVLRLDAERQGVVPARGFAAQRVLVVAHVLADSLPTLTGVLGFFIRVHQRFHSVVVETIRFEQVDDVEFVSSTFHSV